MKRIIIELICIGTMLVITGCGQIQSGPSASGIANGPTGVNDVIEARKTEEEEDFFADYSEDTEATDTTDNAEATEATRGEPDPSVDIDLTAMSGTMVYSEVYNMMTSPSDYVGKKIKMQGQFVIFDDDTTGHTYYACIIQDATACCAQGVEFQTSDKYHFPDDYPQDGEDITVKGVFQTYTEGDTLYCTLKESDIV